MIFMVLNFVLENYFKDILSLVDQSSDIGDKILDCWFLSFNFFFFYGLFRLNRLLLLIILGRYIYVFTCLCAWIYALCHLPCACALHAMLVCLGLDLFVMPCAITVVLFILLHFLVIVHTTWPISKGLDHPFFMCILDCFYVLCLCQPLLFQALSHLALLAGSWLCGYIRRQ